MEESTWLIKQDGSLAFRFNMIVGAQRVLSSFKAMAKGYTAFCLGILPG